MANIPKIVAKPLKAAMKDAVSAHTAVIEGIATAAQKAKDERHAKFHQMEIRRGVKPTGRT